ncbi:MAG: nucleotidyltransferase family protein [Candidatus Saccharibacteria bacterium]
MKEKPDKELLGEYLISLLAAVLRSENPPPVPPGLDLERLFKLASWHSVAGMVCYGLNRLEPLPAPELMKAFRDARSKGLAREARQELETRQILSALEEQQIKCMVVKGLIIKNLYPQPDMRMMADVDILVEANQLEKAGEIMLSLGYTAESTGSNHDVYYKRPVMNIELHRALIAEQYSSLYAYFGSGWERTRLAAGSQYQYEMSPEDFYIYLLAHMAKHYRNGGTGIRSVMDVWVYNHRCQDKLDWDYINAELKKVDLHSFARNMEALAESWFSPNSSYDLYPEITAFILGNGTYGNKQNSAINEFIKIRNDNESFAMAKLKYALRVFFPNLEHMTILYPFLKKYPFLMPLGWFLRVIRTVRFNRNNIRIEIGNISGITKPNVKQMIKNQT